MAKKRMFSGIQPSGDLHLGNYLGAIKNWIRLLDKYEGIFCIVDYHAVTIPYEPREMQEKIHNAALAYLACGLDPERCTIFVQSQVPEHTELCWVFNTLTPLGMLERMTQFKEKADQHKKNVNTGLFAYPVLQAADILLYKAAAVPVGEDQAQHLELSREIARKFNNAFGDTFPEPETILGEAARVMGLDAVNKMSKSLDNYVALDESPELTIEKLTRRAVSDPQRVRRNDPGDPDVCNVFSYHKFFSSEEEIARIDRECRTAGIGCFDCKRIVAENVNRELAPIRERFREFSEKRELVTEVLVEGARYAKSMAEETMKEVREKMGLR